MKTDQLPKRPTRSIGRDAAIALGETKWWENKTPREIAIFQITTDELCCPFEVFHGAVEKTLGHPVWTHEFALRVDGIYFELIGEQDAPSFEEILNLIPERESVSWSPCHQPPNMTSQNGEQRL